MSDNVKLEVLGVFAPTVDYNKSLDDLADYCNQQYELISAGNEEAATFELLILANALSFINFSSEICNVGLSFEDKKITYLEKALDILCENAKEFQMEEEEFNNIVKLASCFLCCLIIKNIGGNFITTNIGVGVHVGTKDIVIYDKIVSRLLNGRDAEIITFYNNLKNN